MLTIEKALELSERQPDKVVVYYDGPQVFIIYDEGNKVYVANHLDDEPEDIWGYTKVNKNFWEQQMETGKVSLKEMMLNPDHETFLVIKKGNLTEIQLVKAKHLPEKLIPSEKSFLKNR